jgi:tyrosine aminotransferase
MSDSWNIVASRAAANTANPIRRIVDQLNIPCNPDKKLIPLSIGDPSVFGNMSPAPEVQAAVTLQITSHTQGGASRHGYPPSTGYVFARAAVAERFSTAASPLTADDVVLASGCSGALELVMSALADPGDNILVPEPGFSLYLTICGNKVHFKLSFVNLLVELTHCLFVVHNRVSRLVITRCCPSPSGKSIWPGSSR